MSRHLPMLQARLISFEARLDAARRRVEAPGQLALDLTGGSRGGGGEPCGAGWIDPKKECRKGGLPAALERGLKPWKAPGYASSPEAANDPDLKRGQQAYTPKGQEAGFEFWRNYESEISMPQEDQDQLYKSLEADGWKVLTYTHGISKGRRTATRERQLPGDRGLVHDQVVFEGGKVRLLRTHQFRSAAMPYLARDVEPVGELASPGGETTKTFFRVKGTAGKEQRIVARTRTPGSGYQGVVELEGPDAATKAWEAAQRETVERYQFGQNITTTRIPGMKVRKPLTLDSLADRLDALELRFDARRKIKVSPGQLGLDLTGAGAAAGKGPGGGEPCGNSWIDPKKTCRQGQAASEELPVTTAAPFSSETMQRLVAGIRNRAFAPPSARHDGTDLSLAMQKLAETPGLVGENARGAMAFMEEAQAKVIIAPVREFAPALDPKASPANWSRIETVDQNVERFRAYVQDRINTAEMGRNFARRTKLWPADLVKAMEADNSPDGKFNAKQLKIALNGQPKGLGFEKEYAEFNQTYEAYKAATTKKDRDALGTKLQGLHARLMAQSHATGPDGELQAVRLSISMATTLDKTMGHYHPRGNTYWKVSMAGRKGSVLHFDEIDPQQLSSLVSNAIFEQERNRVFHFSGVNGMNNSETALTTHLHELGHMVHDFSSRRVRSMPNGEGKEELYTIHSGDSMEEATPAIQAIHARQQGPTKYSNTNVAELFAESFAAYVLAPDALKSKNRELYEWVHFALRRARSAAVRSREATGNHVQW